MSSLYCSKTNKKIILQKQIASSGEGQVWTTETPDVLAKIYHTSTLQRQEKLKVMFKYPPQDPNQEQNHISFAWPQSLLTNKNGIIMGFLMPKIAEGRELIDIYNPRRRNKVGLKIDWYFLHVVAHNISSIIHSIHQAGYILGDIKPQNILVNSQAVPSIIDTDSFQVTNPKNGQIYRCLVGSEGFTPPELFNQDFAQINQTEIHDRFRLGVVIYYLLFGSHPFQGKWTGQGDSPELTELIRKGYWAFANTGLIRPSSLTIPLNILHPVLKDCFIKCFNDGYQNPRLRPNAQEWQKSLQVAIQSLKKCGQKSQHFYYSGIENCYWCQRQAELKIDIFGEQTKVKVTNNYQQKDAFYKNSVLFSSRPRQNALGRRFQYSGNYASPHTSIPSYPPLFKPSFINQFFKNFNKYTAFIVGNIFLLASFLIVLFLFQDFPQSNNPVVNQSNIRWDTVPKNINDTKCGADSCEIAYNNRGYQRYIKGDHLGAIADFNKAIQINPKLADAYYNRGLANQALGNEKLAEQDLLKSVALDPENININPPPVVAKEKNYPLENVPLTIPKNLESDVFKLPKTEQEKLDQQLQERIPIKEKDQSKMPAIKNSLPTISNNIKSSQPPNYYLQGLEDYKPSLNANSPLNKSKISNSDNLSIKIKNYSDNQLNKSKKFSELNSNLALSFFQRGIFYRNSGIYTEAIKNFEQAYFLLQKEGNTAAAEDVEVMISELRAKIIQ